MLLNSTIDISSRECLYTYIYCICVCHRFDIWSIKFRNVSSPVMDIKFAERKRDISLFERLTRSMRSSMFLFESLTPLLRENIQQYIRYLTRTYKIWFKISYILAHYNKITEPCRIFPSKRKPVESGLLVINRVISKSFVAILTTSFERKKNLKGKKDLYTHYKLTHR